MSLSACPPTRRRLARHGAIVRWLLAAGLLSLLLAACQSGTSTRPVRTAAPPPVAPVAWTPDGLGQPDSAPTRQADAPGRVGAPGQPAGQLGQPGQPGLKIGFVWETDDATVLDHPTALALDRHGHLYVVDAGHSRIAVFDHDGQLLRAWGGPGGDAGQFRFLGTGHCPDGYHPESCVAAAGGGVVVDAQDHVYVADIGNHRVQIFDTAGRFLGGWGHEGSRPGELRRPGGIAVDGRGRVYVSDGENHRVQVFDRDGRFLTLWGSPGRGEGQFQRPDALALDGQGRLAVADLWNERVQLFDQDGRYLEAWRVAGGAPRAVGLAFDAQGDLVVGGAVGQVQQLDGAGRALRSWRADWQGQGRLVRPAGVAVDEAGDIYVADAGGDRVVTFRVLTPVTR